MHHKNNGDVVFVINLKIKKQNKPERNEKWWSCGVYVDFFFKHFIQQKLKYNKWHCFLQDFSARRIHFSSGCSKNHIKMQESNQKSFILTRNFLAVKKKL